MSKLKITETDLTQFSYAERQWKGIAYYTPEAESFQDGLDQLKEMCETGNFSDLAALKEDLEMYYEQLKEQAEEYQEKLERLGYERCPNCGAIEKTEEHNGQHYLPCCMADPVTGKEIDTEKL